MGTVEFLAEARALAPGLARLAAEKAFTSLAAQWEHATVYASRSLDYVEVFELEGPLQSPTWWRRSWLTLGGFDELFLTEKHFRWTYVITHEETMGIGPYFLEHIETIE